VECHPDMIEDEVEEVLHSEAEVEEVILSDFQEADHLNQEGNHLSPLNV